MTTRLGLMAIFLLIPFDASAIVRYMVQGMTCAEVQEALDRDGTAILYRQSGSGVSLYDRFVSDGARCAALSTATAVRIAVADTEECRVSKCIELHRFGG